MKSDDENILCNGTLKAHGHITQVADMKNNKLKHWGRMAFPYTDLD